VDHYCIYLFGQSGEVTTKIKEKWKDYEEVLNNIMTISRQRVDEITELGQSLQKRNAAFTERRHYEEKVNVLSPGGKKDRNIIKLDRATEVLTATHMVSSTRVQEILRKHPRLFRMTAIRLIESIMRVLQEWGSDASSWDPGFQVGEEVRLADGTTGKIDGLGLNKAKINGYMYPCCMLTPSQWGVQSVNTPKKEETEKESRKSTTSSKSRNAWSEKSKEEDDLIADDTDEGIFQGRGTSKEQDLEPEQEDDISAQEIECQPEDFRISPEKVRRGRETQFTITCPPLNGPIEIVKIDGKKVQVISGLSHTAVVLATLEKSDAPGKVEVMTKEGEHAYKSASVEFSLYDPDLFLASPVGSNIKLDPRLIKATRVEGSVNAICFVNITKPFFEVEVEEVQKKLQTRGALFGFIPKRCIPQRGGLRWSSSTELPNGIICGGDLPQLYRGGKKMPTKITWRPRSEISEGDRIQVLLCATQGEGAGAGGKSTESRTEFKIFVNRYEKVSFDVTDQEWLGEDLVGVVDMAGSLRSAFLIDGPEPVLRDLYGNPFQPPTESDLTESELEVKDGEAMDKEETVETPELEEKKEDEQPEGAGISEYF